MVEFVLQVRERGEGPRSQSVQLVFQEHYFFLLLLDHVQQFALVRHVLGLLARVRLRIAARVGLEALYLLPLLDVMLQLAGLGF